MKEVKKRKGLVEASPAFCQNACIFEETEKRRLMFCFVLFFSSGE